MNGRIENWVGAGIATIALHACGPTPQEKFDEAQRYAHEACEGVDGSNLHQALTPERIQGELDFAEQMFDSKTLADIEDLCLRIRSGILARSDWSTSLQLPRE